jgi:hypothetical protein
MRTASVSSPALAPAPRASRAGCRAAPPRRHAAARVVVVTAALPPALAPARLAAAARHAALGFAAATLISAAGAHTRTAPLSPHHAHASPKR